MIIPLLAEEGWMRRAQRWRRRGGQTGELCAELTTPAFGHPSSARKGMSGFGPVMAAN